MGDGNRKLTLYTCTGCDGEIQFPCVQPPEDNPLTCPWPECEGKIVKLKTITPPQEQ